MSKKTKAIIHLKQNPRNVRYEELESVLLNLGFSKRQESTSHVVFSMKGYPPITVPRRKPFLLEVYVKQVLKVLDDLGFLDDEA
jgi:predicted RNA binding protein YcfA (HicA-like mRNA interferase family)